MSVIESLFKYSEARGLLSNPFRETKTHLLEISGDGSYKIVPAQGAASVPRPVDRSSNVVPNLGAETAEIMLGLKGRPKFDAFWNSNAELLNRLGLSGRARLARSFAAKFSADRASVTEALKGADKALGGREQAAWMAPVLEGEPMTEIRQVREWWADAWSVILSDAPPDKAGGGQVEQWTDLLGKTVPVDPTDHCLVTGRRCRRARVHRKISGMPGCDQKVPFSSWNELAYQFLEDDGRYRSQGDNFPVCRRVAYGYPLALSELLSDAGRGDRTAGAARTSDHSVVAVWPSDPSKDAVCSAVIDLVAEYTGLDRVDEAWRAVEEEGGDSIVSVLFLTGHPGRIAVTSWDQPTMDQVRSSLLEFRDLCLSGKVKSPGRLPVAIGTARSVNGRQVYSLPFAVRKDLVRAALVGGPVSARAAGYVARRTVRVRDDDYVGRDGKTKNRAAALLPSRVKLLEGVSAINEGVSS